MTATPASNAASTTEERIAGYLDELARLRAEADAIRQQIVRLEDAIGDEMGVYKLIVNGHTLKRHKRQPRARQWDSDGLLRAVLDSRPPPDPETGEIAIETPIDKVRAVYGLKGYQAKLSELGRRSIQFDEWCSVEPVSGWSIEIR